MVECTWCKYQWRNLTSIVLCRLWKKRRQRSRRMLTSLGQSPAHRYLEHHGQFYPFASFSLPSTFSFLIALSLSVSPQTPSLSVSSQSTPRRLASVFLSLCDWFLWGVAVRYLDRIKLFQPSSVTVGKLFSYFWYECYCIYVEVYVIRLLCFGSF